MRLRLSGLERRLLQGALWSLLGAGVTRALLFAASVAAGRLLGADAFGKLGMLQSTAGLFGALAGASLSLGATRLVAEARDREPALAGALIGRAYRLTLVLGTLGAVGVWGLAELLGGRVLEAPALVPALRLASILVLTGALAGVQGGVLAGLDAFRPLALASLARGALSFVAITAGAHQAGLWGALVGQVVAEAVSTALLHLAIRGAARARGLTLELGFRDKAPASEAQRAAEAGGASLTRFTVPTLLGTVLLQPVFWLCNVELVRHGQDFAELGVFTAAERWRQVLLFIPATLSGNVLAALSNLRGAGDPHGYWRVFRRSTAGLAALVLVPGLALGLLAEPALGLFGADYRGGAATMQVLVASCLPMALNTCLGQVLVTESRPWLRFAADVVLGALLLGAARVLVPSHGAFGLAWAFLLAYAGAALALAVMLCWTLPRSTPAAAAVQAAAEPARPRLLQLTTVPMTLRFLRGQAGYLRAAGWEVEVASSPGSELQAFAEREGVRAWAVHLSRRITPVRDLGSLAALAWLLWRRRPQILHAHTPKAGLLGMLAATVARVPVRIYHLHGLPLETASGWKRRLLWWSDRVACALAHRVWAVSPSLAERVLDERLCAPGKLAVPASGSINGVDGEEAFHPERLRPHAVAERARLGVPEGALLVGFVGRVVRDKGLVELAEAWRDVRARFPLARLVVVGPEEDTDPLPEECLRALRADERVQLLGPRDEVAPLMAALDLLVLPTYREGLGMVLLEAGALGLPVVASRTTGCVDVVRDGETGTLVPPRDAPALAEAMARYLADPRLRQAHGEAARAHVLRRFSQRRVWGALLEAYGRVLQDAGLCDGRETPVVPRVS